MRLKRGTQLAILSCVTVGLWSNAVAAKRVVFINFGAEAVINTAAHDPSMNSYNTTGFTPGNVGGWPALTPDQKSEIMWLFKEAGVAFDLEFVDERPAVGNYDMLLFGSDVEEGALFPGLAGCSTAIGVADCDDGNAENISFLFWGCMTDAQQMNMERVVHTGFTGLGFGWGMEQTNGIGEIMGSFTNSALDFSNMCIATSGASQCTHIGCAANSQNSTADLNARVGPRVNDGAPTVAITSPADGAMLASGDFNVTADVDDAFGGLTVSLTVVEADLTYIDENDPQWVYEWGLAGVPDGPWTLRVDAEDADGMITSEMISVCVGAEPCEATTTGGGSTSSGGSTSGGSTTSAGSTSGGGSTTGASTGDVTTGVTTVATTVTTSATSGNPFGDDAETGCGCRADAPAPAALGLLGLGLLGVRRRRATRS